MSGLLPQALRLTAEHGVPIDKDTFHGKELLWDLAGEYGSGEEAEDAFDELMEKEIVFGREAVRSVLLSDSTERETILYVYNESAGRWPDYHLSTPEQSIKKIGSVIIQNCYADGLHMHGKQVANHYTTVALLDILSSGETYASRIQMSRCTTCTDEYHDHDKEVIKGLGFGKALDSPGTYEETLYDPLSDAPATSQLRTLKLPKAARILDAYQTDQLGDFLQNTFTE